MAQLIHLILLWFLGEALNMGMEFWLIWCMAAFVQVIQFLLKYIKD